jgi:uncharacterized protein YqeY
LAISEQVRAEINGAIKAGERQRAAALRMVLSELQKAAKEGEDDELAVLRRERKRRLEAASAFEDGGRPELAAQELSEAELIERYLPPELSEDELERLVEQAISESGASSIRDMGRVMKLVGERSGGRADGRAAAARVRAALERVGAP